jgi:hypothetical protein
MTDHNQKEQQKPTGKARLTAEQWVLLFAATSFLVFVVIIVFMFMPLLKPSSQYPSPVAQKPIPVVADTPTLLATRTPTPGSEIAVAATPVPSAVYDGRKPTSMYTPRATSLPGVPPLPFFPIPKPIDVVDLARIMQGESTGDLDAAYYVGWVAKNRLLHEGYGDSYALVSSGFFGYRADIEPTDAFIALARKVIQARQDPTNGCMYALSRTDITKLGVPPERADVTRGEWFFFRVWPVRRY